MFQILDIIVIGRFDALLDRSIEATSPSTTSGDECPEEGKEKTDDGTEDIDDTSSGNADKGRDEDELDAMPHGTEEFLGLVVMVLGPGEQLARQSVEARQNVEAVDGLNLGTTVHAATLLEGTLETLELGLRHGLPLAQPRMLVALLDLTVLAPLIRAAVVVGDGIRVREDDHQVPLGILDDFEDDGGDVDVEAFDRVDGQAHWDDLSSVFGNRLRLGEVPGVAADEQTAGFCAVGFRRRSHNLGGSVGTHLWDVDERRPETKGRRIELGSVE